MSHMGAGLQRPYMLMVQQDVSQQISGLQAPCVSDGAIFPASVCTSIFVILSPIDVGPSTFECHHTCILFMT